MNKETGEIIKKIIDMFVSREEIMKELLEDREKEVRRLKEELNKFYE